MVLCSDGAGELRAPTTATVQRQRQQESRNTLPALLVTWSAFHELVSNSRAFFLFDSATCHFCLCCCYLANPSSHFIPTQDQIFSLASDRQRHENTRAVGRTSTRRHLGWLPQSKKPARCQWRCYCVASPCPRSDEASSRIAGSSAAHGAVGGIMLLVPGTMSSLQGHGGGRRGSSRAHRQCCLGPERVSHEMPACRTTSRARRPSSA